MRGGDTIERIKEHFLVCDLCNRKLVDSDGNVTKDFVRTDWGLIRRSKFEEMDEPEEGFVVHETFEEGDVVLKSHEMFRPMVII